MPHFDIETHNLKIRAIDSLQDIDSDSESAHQKADHVLLQFLRKAGHAALADEWEKTKKRCGFWYS